jgi:hypothetical protein
MQVVLIPEAAVKGLPGEMALLADRTDCDVLNSRVAHAFPAGPGQLETRGFACGMILFHEHILALTCRIGQIF